MKRNRLAFVVARMFLGLFVLAMSVQSFADEKKDSKTVAKDVKFACAIHGPAQMVLTLSLETGTSRKIEIIGGSDTKSWVVKIGNQDAKKNNGDTVKVRSGDTITWRVAARTHGVVFADQDLAQAMLDFDTTVGKPLKDQKVLGENDPDWMKFGPKLWGTDGTNEVGVLASCKVK
jgi:plastocyanin